MRATIRQVAERAGVSRTTVSNVMLGRTDQMNPKTRDAVMNAMRELDYVPVKPTLQNRQSKTNVIAIPIDKANKMLWGVNLAPYQGVYQGAMQFGYDVMLLMRPNPDWAKDIGQVQLLDRRSDGIVFASPVIGESEEAFAALGRHNIPAIVCFRRDLPPGINWVDPDNEAIIRGGVMHLLEFGHRKIGYLTEFGEVLHDNLARRDAFRALMQEVGLPENASLIFGGHGYQVEEELIDQILASGVTALQCHNDGLAGSFKAKIEKRGLNVPQDISVVGVDGYHAPTFGIDSMEFRFEDVGFKAVELLDKRINGAEIEECNCSLQPQLVVRGSVRRL